MDHFLYRNEKTSQISFPLGGIGTGCIGLAGNGRLIDWEISTGPTKAASTASPTLPSAPNGTGKQLTPASSTAI